MAQTFPQSRRKFLSRLRFFAAPAILGGGLGAYGYGSVLERHRVSVERHDLPLGLTAQGPSHLRIVTLTDLHFDPLYEIDYLSQCVAKVNALRPDLILLTGDYVTHTPHRIEELARVLSGLRAKSGVYLSMGNHDHWHRRDLISKAMVKEGLQVLANSHARVVCGDGQIILAGLESQWGGSPNWAKAAVGVAKDERVIMLMHEPDVADSLSRDSRIVLQCSGHTHGGQVRVPGYGALILPSYGKRYQAGFYQVGSLTLHVNRGLGTVDKHVRFMCPPEIACFDVVNTDRLRV